MNIFYNINEDFALKTISTNTKKQIIATVGVQDEKKKFPVFKIKGVENYFATDGHEYYILGDLAQVDRKILKNPASLANVFEKMLLPYTPITIYAPPDNLRGIKILEGIIGFVSMVLYFAIPCAVLYFIRLI